QGKDMLAARATHLGAWGRCGVCFKTKTCGALWALNDHGQLFSILKLAKTSDSSNFYTSVADTVQYGKYTLLGRLNKGGMAEVFLAKGKNTAGQVQLFALKRTLPQLSEDHDFVSMFTDEARIAK